MWIEEIFLERFGGFKQMLIENLDSELTLIVGPNEAGKSTILEFIRSIFFGYKKKSGKVITNIYEPPDGLLRKGRLIVHDEKGEALRVERAEKAGRKAGELTIRDVRGNAMEPSSLPMIRWGMERSAYETLFAFDLDGMGALDRDSLRGRIVAAALGSLQVNPVDVARRVDQRLKILQKKSTGDDRSLHAIGSRLKNIQGRLKTLEQKPREYVELKRRLEAVTMERKERAAEIEEKKSTLANVAKILRYEEEWKKLVSRDRRIKSVEDAGHFPPDGILRLDQAREKKEESSENEQELGADLENLRSRVKKLSPDRAILQYSEAVIALDRQAQSLMARPAEIEKLRLQILRSERNLDEGIAELGAGWDRERVASSEPSVVLEQSVVETADSWKSFREKIRDLHRELAPCEEACERLRARVALKEEAVEKLRAASQSFLTPEQRNLLGEWKERNSGVRHMRERLFDRNVLLRNLDNERKDLERSLRDPELEAGRWLPWTLTAGSGLLLACGGAAMIIASGAGGEPNKWLFIVIGLGMIGAIPFLIGRNIVRERRERELIRRQRSILTEKTAAISREFVAIDKEQTRLVGGINRMTARMEEIAGYVLGDPDASHEDVLEAERRSLSAEEAVRRKEGVEDALESELTDLQDHEHSRSGISARLARATQEFDELRASWDSFLREKGMEPALEPERIRELIPRISFLKKEMRRISEQQEILAGMEKDWDQFVVRAETLRDKMGQPPDPTVSPLDRVERWGRAERESREALLSKKALSDRVKDTEQRLKAERNKIEQADQRIASLLETAGVDDEETFRERGERHALYKDLQHERRVLTDNLVSGLHAADEASMWQLMAEQDWDEKARIEAESEKDLKKLGKELEKLADTHGRLSQEIEALEAEEETERLLAEKEEWVARLNEGGREWLTWKMAAILLARTLRVYESEKQPKVMEKTSDIFSRITAGAFRGVRFPMDSDRIRVERRDRSSVDETLLSRGTMEQVYLSLRLAHLDVYHRDESTVPLIIDDILVNFDPERARQTARILTKFSKETGIQILFFTCHPHTADLFPANVARILLG